MRERAVNASAVTKVRLSLVVGAVVGVLVGWFGSDRTAPLVGWDVAALMFSSWTWLSIWPMDARQTKLHARPENPSRGVSEVTLISAAIASLGAVAAVLFGAGHAPGNLKYLEASFALVSIFISWTIIHTVFTLKYAKMYYDDDPGGVDFNEPDEPQYSDFAYLSFTIGMTFQVSDTNLQDKAIRRTALRHAWLSFPMGAIIIAASINLVSGLAK